MDGRLFVLQDQREFKKKRKRRKRFKNRFRQISLMAAEHQKRLRSLNHFNHL
jgi:hypothetical protein